MDWKLVQFITIKTYIDKIKTQLNAHKVAKSKKYSKKEMYLWSCVVVLLRLTNKIENTTRIPSFSAITNFHFTNKNSHG